MRYLSYAFRFLVWIGVTALLTGVVGCAGKSAPKGPMTPQVEEAFVALTLSPEERAVRDRAAEIERRKVLEEAEKRVKAVDTPAKRQARKELEKEEDRRTKLARDSAKLAKRVAMKGCAVGSVPVNPSAAQFTSFVDSGAVTIVNKSEVTVDITTTFRGMGDVVLGLCPNGSLNLSFKSPGWMGSQYIPEEVLLTATGHSGGSDSYSVRIIRSYGNSGTQATPYKWEIQVR